MIRPAAILFVTMVSFTPAKAVVYSTYTGHISGFTDYRGSLGSFSIGDTVVLKYMYDPRVNRGNIVKDNNSYRHFGTGDLSPVTGEFTIGVNKYSLSPTNSGQFFLLNDFGGKGGDDWSNQVVDQKIQGDTRTLTEITASIGEHEFLNSLDPNVSFSLSLPNAYSFFYDGIRIAYFNSITGAFLRDEYVHMSFDSLQVQNVFAPDVPEPATWAMLIAGFGMLGTAVRRNSRPVLASA